MGLELPCTARLGRRISEGKALLETNELIFRGGFRIAIPLKSARSVTASDGELTITSSEGTLVLSLGAAAPKWADRILHPKSRIDKIGVKPGSVVSVIGAVETSLHDELAARSVSVATGRPRKGSDIIFYAVDRRQQLTRIPRLASFLNDAGALWVVRPKGVATVTESDVMKAGRAAGLVDVKVVSFSPTHTAEKFVIPVSRRGP